MNCNNSRNIFIFKDKLKMGLLPLLFFALRIFHSAIRHLLDCLLRPPLLKGLPPAFLKLRPAPENYAISQIKQQHNHIFILLGVWPQDS
jgi:hypothetical protein